MEKNLTPSFDYTQWHVPWNRANKSNLVYNKKRKLQEFIHFLPLNFLCVIVIYIAAKINWFFFLITETLYISIILLIANIWAKSYRETNFTKACASTRPSLPPSHTHTHDINDGVINILIVYILLLVDSCVSVDPRS